MNSTKQLFTPPKDLSELAGDGKNAILVTTPAEHQWGHWVVKDANDFIYDPEAGITDIEGYIDITGYRLVKVAIEFELPK